MARGHLFHPHIQPPGRYCPRRTHGDQCVKQKADILFFIILFNNSFIISLFSGFFLISNVPSNIAIMI